MSPLQHFGPEAIVGETLAWIDESVSCEFEVHVDGFDGGFVGSCSFVGVELDGSNYQMLVGHNMMRVV